MNIFPFNEPLTFFATLVSLGIINFFALLQIKSDLREVDALPETSSWGRRWPTEILRAHQKLAPSSPLRAVYISSQIAMVALILSFALFGEKTHQR
jgi:hypothetical protein